MEAKKRETFYEDFNFFKNNYTYWKLFLKPEGRIGVSKIYDIFIIAFAIFMVVGMFFGILNLSAWIVVPLLLIAMILLGIGNIIDLIKIRDKFNKSGLPLPPKHLFYKWRSEDLENIRVKKIFDDYTRVSNPIIEERVALASHLVEKYSKTPDFSFFKVFEFFGKQFYLITVGILLVLLKAKLDEKNIKIFYQWFFIIFLLSITVAVLWNLLVRRALLENRLVKVKFLNDYIFCLKNILLIRKVRENNS